MKEIYLLSGLGADKRIFDFIDLSGYKITHLDWIAPLENESMEHYAKRLSAQIQSKRPTLIGVSFGGMMSIEIGKLMEVEKIILISSVKTRYELPRYFRVLGRLGFQHLIPVRRLNKANAVMFHFFGAETESEKRLLSLILQESDTAFLKWGIQKIVRWKNKALLKNVVHIHGTNDRIFPIKTADYKIHDGGHLMLVSRAEELSGLINKVLS